MLIGASAWLLGAISATAGSLYAVEELGQGLLAQHTSQVSVTMVNAELARGNADRPASTPSPSHSPAASPNASRAVHKARPAHTRRTAKPVTRDTSKLLTSSGGTVVASCRQGNAYLLYWSPAQGFATHRFVRGPSPVASVTFTSSSGGDLMKVTCDSSGVPIAHVSPLGWGGGSHHDE